MNKIETLFELKYETKHQRKRTRKRMAKIENKEKADLLLKQYGIEPHKFSPIHYRIGRYDFWPTTQKWMKFEIKHCRTVYLKKHSGYGLDKLLAILEVEGIADEETIYS